MNTPSRFTLAEVAAPVGWTAMLLRQELPIDDEVELLSYRDAVAALMERLPAFAEVHPEEVFLLFERLRPGKEVELLKSNARWWLPEFGVGIWLDREPPTTWTTEEFEAAPPGTLRPVIERVVRLQTDPVAQVSAWRMLLGSGALIRVSAAAANVFTTQCTEWLQPTLSDDSLTSFPFYTPLLQGQTLLSSADAYDLPLADQLPTAEAYVRESVEDGGLLVVVHQPPETVWKQLLQTPWDIDVSRMARSSS